jgi:4-hydroxybenzoate polyprenyltransferase
MATPQAPQYIGRRLPGPPPGRQRHVLARLLDERDSTGGTAKAALFLLHPGPSLLVTGVTVGAAAMALRAAPSPTLALRLVLLMLPAQFAIGTTNDLADLRSDQAAKPHKPLARGAVPWRWALAVTVALVAISLFAAGSFGWAVLAATVVGLGAGLAYDLGLKRGLASWLPWWAGFTALPICAFTAAGRFTPTLWWCVPLTALLALGLHCANALPDLAGDRQSGVRNLPVLLGESRTRALMVLSLVACTVLTVLLVLALHQGGALLLPAWTFMLLSIAAAALLPRLRRTPFPLLALASAALAVAWLASLPV